MAQGGERLGLTLETRGEGGVIGALWSEKLERDRAVQGFLPRLVNDAHAAAADLAFERE